MCWKKVRSCRTSSTRLYVSNWRRKRSQERRSPVAGRQADDQMAGAATAARAARADDRAVQAARQMAGDNADRTFLAQHSQSGQKVELRRCREAMLRQHPEAVQQFVEAAEKPACSENRKLVEVHRPESQDDMCYVALRTAAGSVSAAVAAAPSIRWRRSNGPTADEDAGGGATEPGPGAGAGGAEPAAAGTGGGDPGCRGDPPAETENQSQTGNPTRPRRRRATPRRRRTRLLPPAPSIPAIEIKLPGRMSCGRSPPHPQAFQDRDRQTPEEAECRAG